MTKPLISVIIKALNEEEKIASCIESVIDELTDFDSEIILVDSLSIDSTVEIAKSYPVRIVQFKNAGDVCVGAAAQLGYQCSKGDFIYLIDGDMTCAPGFLKKALDVLLNDPMVSGVGGRIFDRQKNTIADKRRSVIYEKITSMVKVTSLGGGGLYRRVHIEEVKYFSHPSFKACEEVELAVRLRCQGYSLIRLPVISVFHIGHVESDLQMLLRLWKNGRLTAYAVFLRSAFGKKWFQLSLRECWFFIPVLLSICIALLTVLLVSISFSLRIFLFYWMMCFLVLFVQKKNARDAFWALISWWFLFFASFSSPGLDNDLISRGIRYHENN